MASSIGVGGLCCFTGHVASGEPKGTYEELEGVRTYVALPQGAAPTKAVIIFTDVFGLGPPNAQLMADKYAEAGFLAAVPDLFGGAPINHVTMNRMMKLVGVWEPPADGLRERLQRRLRNVLYVPLVIFSIAPFALRAFPWSERMPVAEAVYDALKSKHGIQHFGVVGFCYGGGFCLDWASQASKVDAFVVAHTQISVPASLKKLQKPGLILLADRDFAQPVKTREAIQAYTKEHLARVGVEAIFYPGTYHGFAIRGDPTNPVIEKAAEDSFKASLALFQQHVGSLDQAKGQALSATKEKP